ncbi:MAG: bifunctional D-glycero-beta-D-manno-heptose-7-phosphate kinase/D-glycero-beta-D-manno-heptose 1-phosphate adenylyltransferase HldE [Gammaproteobacteria bacterium]
MTSRASSSGPATVVVVGDVMLDRYWRGIASRISPEAPVPIVRVTGEEDRVGGAANVAANAASLGAQVILIGVVGRDAAADGLEALCRSHGFETRFIRRADVPTTLKLRVLAQHQQLIRMDFEASPSANLYAEIDAALTASLDAARVVVFSDYAKGALADVQRLVARARAAGRIVIVDPKGADFARYAGADFITPNLSEFEAVVGRCADDVDLVKRARELARKHAIGAVLVTRGEHGMALVPADGEVTQLAAKARDVFDVTGAGDTVCAALAWALADGMSRERAIEWANTAAGIAVGKLGTAVVSAAELRDAMEPSDRDAGAALDIDDLVREVAVARRRGLRVVMTNGCFDLLHAGHVRYLEAAAALGDRLIVAVNSDASVRRLKGESRPVNPLAARVEVLCGLRAVDWVVTFDSDTPRDLIARILPDVLVKGGDYEVANIAGSAEVLAAGGRVTTVPFHAGFSSTGMLDRAGTRGGVET